ncbi:hypothetical protein [Agrobacterium tumefaciens]|uniref:hypothetical protein n=1 Tax=Agrobacterium tumefaciens TaxID=358 RepID=UPI0001FC5B6C|nr:hypothetical protein [Agrobacterium tumefaciens]ADY64683.1 hypothetical protein AGROH133_06724 [Agrobacterium tumefaciens]
MLGSQAAERIEDADFPFWDWCFKSGQGKKAAKKTSRKLFLLEKMPGAGFSSAVLREN